MKALSLSGDEQYFQKAGSAMLAEGLKQNTVTEYFNIRRSGGGLGSEADAHFVQLFQHNRAITTFNDLTVKEGDLSIPRAQA